MGGEGKAKGVDGEAVLAALRAEIAAVAEEVRRSRYLSGVAVGRAAAASPSPERRMTDA